MTRKRRRAQALVEFALLAPVVMVIMFLTIDFGRLVYAYAAVSWATRQAARAVSMQPQATSDCSALQLAENTAQGFVLKADPNSISGNTDPNNPGAIAPTAIPPAGVGYIYIWPAVATSPADTNCNGTGATRAVSPTVQDVAVQIKYTYQPLMPLIGNMVPQIILTTISVVHTEY
jgi:hypothetical protein